MLHPHNIYLAIFNGYFVDQTGIKQSFKTLEFEIRNFYLIHHNTNKINYQYLYLQTIQNLISQNEKHLFLKQK